MLATVGAADCRYAVGLAAHGERVRQAFGRCGRCGSVLRWAGNDETHEIQSESSD